MQTLKTISIRTHSAAETRRTNEEIQKEKEKRIAIYQKMIEENSAITFPTPEEN